jgi:hypothetical protein
MRERAIRTGPGRRCTGRTIAGSDSQDSIIVVGSVPQSLGVSEKLAAASAACVRRWQREEDVDDATELVSSTNHRSLGACPQGRAAAMSSEVNRCTHRYTVTWSTSMPPSAGLLLPSRRDSAAAPR